MHQQISEPDWKHYKVVRQRGLERFCEHALAEVAAITSDTSATFHERYRKLFEVLSARDKELARAFDRFSRSSALFSIFVMLSLDLLTEEECQGFSDELQATIRGWRADFKSRREPRQ